MEKNQQLSSKYRATKLEDLIGNDTAIKQAKELIKKKNAHAVLLHGKTGCGKTTLAGIIARAFLTNDADYLEENIGSETGIDTIRKIAATAAYAPRGNYRVIVLEEVHALTAQAKSSILRPIENPPHDKILFILVTDRPHLLDQQVLDRCLKIQVKPPTKEDLSDFLVKVADNERLLLNLNDNALVEVCDEIASAANCVPRAALQLLQEVSVLDDVKGKAKDLIIRALQNNETDVGKAALCCLLAILSNDKQKTPQQRAQFLISNVTGHDCIALLNRILYINHQLLQHACGATSAQTSYFLKELPKVDITFNSTHRIATKLSEIRMRLTTVSIDPSYVMLPALLDLVMNGE